MASIWEIQDSIQNSVGNYAKNYLDGNTGYTHWANPFKGMVRKIDILACEEIWQAKVAMWGIAAANWFWSSFVPSPVELERKFVAGSYKCGFFLAPGLRSPLDIIWRDGKASEVLLEASSPFTKAIFYWWAAETAWSALSTYTSVIHKQHQCDLTGRETLLSAGVGTFGGGTHHVEGEAGLYTVLRDIFDRYSEAGGHVFIDEPSSVNAIAVGYMTTEGSTLHNVEIGIKYGEEVMQKAYLGTILPFTAQPFSVAGAKGNYDGTVSVWFQCDVEGLTVFPNYINVVRWTVTVDPPDTPTPGWDRSPDPPKLLCQKLYDHIYPVGVG